MGTSVHDIPPNRLDPHPNGSLWLFTTGTGD